MSRIVPGLRRAEDLAARACLAGCSALVFVAAISRVTRMPEATALFM